MTVDHTERIRDDHSVGLTGLAPMGAALARNIATTGRRVVVHNRTTAKMHRLLDEHGGDVGVHGRRGEIVGAATLDDLVAALSPPRIVVLMVKAGSPVDEVIDDLVGRLSPGDVVIDGGNSDHRDTQRRADALRTHELGYLGMGVSGGEEGALHGPSLMPGGHRWAYDAARPLLLDIAARTDERRPCCAYMGPGGAGHFVKMVHNGIEYADMAAIAEVVDLMRAAGWSLEDTADRIERWNDGILGSFLLEITARVLRRVDEESGRPLVELIDDAASQKGTGRLTAKEALDLGEPATTVAEASLHRSLSALTERRRAARANLTDPPTTGRDRPVGRHGDDASGIRARDPDDGDPDAWRAQVADAAHDALVASRLVALCQGFDLLAAASEQHAWNLDLASIAGVWRAGCIIRSELLEPVRQEFADGAPHLIETPLVASGLAHADERWRQAIGIAMASARPVPVLSSALAWYDAWRADRLPTWLIQAQRDLFGAHTYRRTDQPGTFHTDW